MDRSNTEFAALNIAKSEAGVITGNLCDNVF